MATIYIYDEIGEDAYGLVSARAIADSLDSLGEGEPVRVRINSPGGSVFEALAIRQLFADYSGTLSFRIDSLSASAATFLPPAGSLVEISEHARMMIHKPWSVMAGNADAFREHATILDSLQSTIENIYIENGFKGDRSSLQNMLEAETLMTASEAVDHGLADVLVSQPAVAACWRRGMSSVLDEYYMDQPTEQPHVRRQEKASEKVRGYSEDRHQRMQSEHFHRLLEQRKNYV